MNSIFNKNKIKISYSWCANMGCIISSHNKQILSSNSTEYGCICSNRGKCPLRKQMFDSLWYLRRSSQRMSRKS